MTQEALTPRAAALRCKASYEPGENILTHNETDVLVTLLPALKMVILSVRGTEASATPFGVIKRKQFGRLFRRSTWSNLRDIKHDLMFWGKKRSWGRVHYGFWKCANGWIAEHKDLLMAWENQGYRIKLEGHSLGASTAVQMSLELDAIGCQVYSLDVFGEPPSLNRQARDYMDQRNFTRTSYWNENDWIIRAYTGAASYTCIGRTLLTGPAWDDENYHDIDCYIARV